MIQIRPSGHLYQGVAGRFPDCVAVIVLQNVEQSLGRGLLGEGSECANDRLANVDAVGLRLNAQGLQDLQVVRVLPQGQCGGGGNWVSAGQQGFQRCNEILIRPTNRSQCPGNGGFGRCGAVCQNIHYDRTYRRVAPCDEPDRRHIAGALGSIC